MQQLSKPDKILHVYRLIQAECNLFCFQRRLRDTRSLHHRKRAARHAHDRIVNDRNSDQHRDRDQDPFQNIFIHEPLPPFSFRIFLLPGTPHNARFP